MLSKDDLNNGVTFILKLSDAHGEAVQWVQSLRGDAAARWYEIYWRSDWEALRAHGAEVFQNRVTADQAEHVRRAARCIVIHTAAVKAEEIGPPQDARPLEPGWEDDGGSLGRGSHDGLLWHAC